MSFSVSSGSAGASPSPGPFDMHWFAMDLSGVWVAMDWLNAGLLCLLTLGHTTLWVAFVNRSHAYPAPSPTLRHLRHLHDVMIPLFPIAVVWFVGLNGPKLLWGGSWSQLNLFWQVVFGICVIGLLHLGRVVLQHQLTPKPASLTSNHSEFHDIAAELGHKPIARGAYYSLARVPGNGQFQVEFNDKTFHLPNLPEAWDGLTILHLSDWHLTGTVTKDFYLRVSELAATREADLVCFTGDLIDNPKLVDWLPETLGRLQGRLGTFAILGNHDKYLANPEVTRDKLTSLGWQVIGSRCESLSRNGSKLVLGGDETPWIGKPPEFPEDADFRILLCHTPDHISRAKRQQVDLMLSGHNHGGQVQLPGLGPIYSPSRYGVKYASGIFEEPPTLLHVSRGLAGEHPLRWNCPPEITRLILKRSE